MKIRSYLFCSVITALAFAPGLRADAAKPAAPAGAHAHDDETELGGKMDKMSGAFRKLKKQVADATKNEDSLKLVAVIRENSEAGLKLEPAMKADKPAADQAKFVADYQKSMKAFIAELVKLEGALKAGKNEEAAKLVATLGGMQKEGHKEFQKKKPEKDKH